MATLEHSYALNSAVALSLNTLHSSLSRYEPLVVMMSILIGGGRSFKVVGQEWRSGGRAPSGAQGQSL